MRRQARFAFFSIILLAWVSISHLAHAQVGSASPTRRLITQPVDESNLVTLGGNTRREANATNDRGPVSGDFPLEHMQIQLQLPADKEQELEQLNRELVDPASPNYHKWLTPEQFRREFSSAPEDIDAVTSWLQSHGFTVNVVYPRSIDVSGTAGQVRNAFKTDIHNLEVNDVKHFANMSDPQIPASLAPALAGIVSMNDFMPHKLLRPRANYTSGGGYYLVAPADLSTIYNFNPIFMKGTTGQNQTIVVAEDTDVYNYPTDWTTFRSTLGLSGYTSGSFTQVHPQPAPGGNGSNNCTDPGVTADDDEAILDAEWASAGAPSAAIELISCSNTTNFGGFIALQNLLNETSGTLPGIVSISYGESEADNGATSNLSVNNLYQQAVTEGVSVFVSAGDEGAASSDAGNSSATHGTAVSGLTSTPYNVSVGGTDFSDYYAGTSSTYWNSTNTTAYGSAKSYIPEIPWNNSCAGELLATYDGDPTTYDSSGFCNTPTGENYLDVTAGSGGPSGCATGIPSTSGVVSGTCAGYPKPSWQSVLGNPNDKVRDIPDVSLFAANGVWGHYYVVCFSDPSNGGKSCAGVPNTWTGFGGTSFAAPIMASVQVLINQTIGSNAGNPNPTYYSLANAEYGSAGSASCNSTLGNGVASSCIFYDVTQGDMDVNCAGTRDCFLPSGKHGVLSESSSSYQPAFGTTTGWDFATGIGSINVANLVNSWPTSSTVLVPNVVGDTQAAATTAITGSGLLLGTVTTASSSTVPSGDVISEAPTAGTSVATGSTVNLVVSTGPPTVSVPNVVGDTQAAATTAITGSGLLLGTVTTASSSTVPSGDVISEAPTAGTSVATGSTVNLVVSTGPPTVSVPNVVGDTQAAATTAITGSGLLLGTVTTASSSTVPSGDVISEAPTAGTPVATGSTVNLVVSTGPPTVSVPNVVGDTQAAATTAITGSGLLLGTVTTASSSTVPSGDVISEAPTAGTSVATGSTVNLVVSTGPPTVSVPNVVGDTQAAATTAITGSGLLLGTVTTASSSTVPSGDVISEAPTAGTSVATGSAVNLVVSTGSGGGGGAAAVFSSADTATQGNWMGVYGADGYDVVNGPQYPAGGILSYGSYSVQGESEWTWAASSSDRRALQIDSQGDRTAATWYSPSSFSLNVNFTDTNTHRVALYAIDWDSGGRAETITITNASTGQVLDTRSMPNTNPSSPSYTNTTSANFVSGSYLVWNISGHVTITVTSNSGSNAVVSGIFFGSAQQSAPQITSANSATFTANTAGTFTVTTTGVPIPSLTYSGALPSGVTFVNNGNGTGTLSGTSAVGSNPSYALTFTASNGIGTPATQGFTLTVNPESVSSAPAATFVSADTTTQGNWMGVYGADGYDVVNGPQYPAGGILSYGSYSVQGESEWTWAASSSDRRALEIDSQGDRTAATWYSPSSFSLNVNFTDTNTHRVALYAIDWDSGGRAETITITNASTGQVLDTRSMPNTNPSSPSYTNTTSANFVSGSYLVWNISGHVTITVTSNSGSNAVVSGIFFGSAQQSAPQITSANSATFTANTAGTFTVTTTGVPIPSLTYSGALPSGVTFVNNGNGTGTLSGTSAVGSNPSYALTFTASNGIGTPATQGFTLTVNPESVSSAPAATFVSADTATQGNWMGVYGADGYDVVNGPQYPAGGILSYGSYSVQGESEWTWAASSSDRRALEIDSQGDRTAATWYSPSSFSLNVNFTDTNTHRVALYAIDWDSKGRAETVTITNVSTGQVLDTRSMPNTTPSSPSYTNTTSANFVSGSYLVWDISGHVTITVTSNSGPNAVVSGIFFDP